MTASTAAEQSILAKGASLSLSGKRAPGWHPRRGRERRMQCSSLERGLTAKGGRMPCPCRLTDGPAELNFVGRPGRPARGIVDVVFFFPCLVVGWTGAPTINSSLQPVLDGSHSPRTTILVLVSNAQAHRFTLFLLFLPRLSKKPWNPLKNTPNPPMGHR